MKGELYFGCAETDKYAPKEMIDKLDAHLQSIPGLRHRVEWYMGAEHGFAFPQRQGIFHKPSAERHWERLFALFKRNIGYASAHSRARSRRPDHGTATIAR